MRNRARRIATLFGGGAVAFGCLLPSLEVDDSLGGAGRGGGGGDAGTDAGVSTDGGSGAPSGGTAATNASSSGPSSTNSTAMSAGGTPSAGGAPGTGGAVECDVPDPVTCDDDECVDLDFSEAHCGACGAACMMGACLSGVCCDEEPLPGTLLEELARRPMDTTYAPAGPLLATTPGHALTADDLTGLVLCAAHDAGLDDPAEVTPAALQHTYAAYLVRQGVRFADLAPVLGRLSPDALAAYSALAPDGPRQAAEQIDWSYPSREDLPRPTATGNA
jgi:hypothetical protein